MEFEIPEGLTDLLQDFTVSVLREKPVDLIQFAEDYFKTLNECRSDRDLLGRKGVRFGGPGDASPMQTDNSDEEPSVPPKNTFQRRKSVSAERYDPEADDDGDEPKIIHPKSDEQRKRLNETIHNTLIFRSLDTEQLQEVIDAMFEKVVQPDEHVIDQGADGDNFYVIVSGTFDICVTVDGTEKAVGSYTNEGSFGELALMYNMPRAATIIATSEGTLWAMDRATFRRIVLKTAFNKRKMYENLLENVPMLKTLEAYERMNVADALVSRTFQNDELIIRQGDNADCMYFVEDGEVRITIKQTEACAEVEVTRCNTGQYFGELALLTHKPRAASAYANGIVKCAVLDVRAFERLLGPCMDILKRNISDYEGQLVSLFGSTSNMTDLR